MPRIKVVRNERHKFDSRRDYLEKRAKSAHADLCRALVDEAPAPSLLDEGRSSSWMDVPWLTLILGSGCLDVSGGGPLSPIQFGRAAYRALGEDGVTARARRGIDLRGGAAHFTAALAHDRLGVTGPTPRDLSFEDGHEPIDVALSPIAAATACLAYLLTRAYHGMKAVEGTPLSRWNEDVAALGRDWFVPPQIEDLVELAAEQGKSVLALLDGADATPRWIHDALPGLLDDVLEVLRLRDEERGVTGEIALRQLRMVTEVAWYLMTIGTATYVGWSDLLFALTLNDDSKRLDHTRPRFLRLVDQQTFLKQLLKDPTERSWSDRAGRRADPVHVAEVGGPREGPRSNGDAPSSGRERFYDAAAEMMWAQQEAVDAARGPSGSPASLDSAVLPPVSAFVTSFDVELEMALAQTSAGRDFFVVLPVHVASSRDDPHVEPCWLRAHIHLDGEDHEARLAQLLAPKTWEVLSERTRLERFYEGPHVVRQSGCPLFTLPGQPGSSPETGDEVRTDAEDIRAQLGELGVDGLEPGRTTIEHAVTVDEHLAVQQSEAELFFTVADRTDAEVRVNRGLPLPLRSSSAAPTISGPNPRLWMALGVPLTDPAIRHRLFSQITAKRLLDSLRRGRSAGNDDVRQVPGHAAGGEYETAPTAPEQDPGSGLMRRRPGRAAVADAEVGGGPGFATAATEDDQGIADEVDRGGLRDSEHNEIRGLVVNRRISDDEANLLYWLGLDVIPGTVSQFTDDLLHYAGHLRHGPRSWPRGAASVCPLAQEARA